MRSEAPAIGATFYSRASGHVVAKSYGTTWTDRDGDVTCYVYWRPATDAERVAYVEARRQQPRKLIVTLPAEPAPEVGQTFRLRDGTTVVAVAVGRHRYLDIDVEDVTSFYSSELWDRDVVDVEYTAVA